MCACLCIYVRMFRHHSVYLPSVGRRKYVCECVCVREKERERVCVGVCVREKRERTHSKFGNLVQHSCSLVLFHLLPTDTQTDRHAQTRTHAQTDGRAHTHTHTHAREHTHPRRISDRLHACAHIQVCVRMSYSRNAESYSCIDHHYLIIIQQCSDTHQNTILRVYEGYTHMPNTILVRVKTLNPKP